MINMDRNNNMYDYILTSNHYSGDVETIYFIKDKLTRNQFEGYLIGNTIKYLSRYNSKGGEIKDIKKAVTYLTWMVDHKNEKVM